MMMFTPHADFASRESPVLFVGGYEIGPEQIAAGIAAMHAAPDFRSYDVVIALSDAGVPMESADVRVASRAADMLLQAEREAGRIEFSASRWKACR